MRPITVTLAGIGNSNPIPLNLYATPFSVSVAVGGIVGSVTYKMQATYDDVFAPGYNPATGTWIDDTNMTGKTAAFATALNAPVRAVRFNNTGTGSLVGTILQAGA